MTRQVSALLGAIGLAALGMTAQAATTTLDTGEYTVSYDDAVFGTIDAWGSSAGGARTFHWSIPTASNGDSTVALDGASAKAFDLPSLTIAAHAGLQISDLVFHAQGGVFHGGSASVNLFLGNYAGAANNGTWTLDFAIPTPSFSSWTSPPAVLVLNRTGLSSNGGMYADQASFSFTVSAVPEPATYALMFAGLGAVGFVARRRQRG